MLKFECGHEPSLGEAAAILDVAQSAIDSGFGIVAIDPDRGLYTVRVSEDDLGAGKGDGAFQGPYSDPKIAPMHGRPKS